MRICILCEDKNVNDAREKASVILLNENRILDSKFEFLKKLNVQKVSTQYLSIPVSPTGESPATHWFCFLSTEQSGYQKLKDAQSLTIIEESSPKDFLEKWNLKIIK